MKLKISNKEQKLIRVVKKAIDKSRKEEDKVIAALASSMGLTAPQEEILWDYIHNNSTWRIELENK
jgi:hypothetical protein